MSNDVERLARAVEKLSFVVNDMMGVLLNDPTYRDRLREANATLGAVLAAVATLPPPAPSALDRAAGRYKVRMKELFDVTVGSDRARTEASEYVLAFLDGVEAMPKDGSGYHVLGNGVYMHEFILAALRALAGGGSK